MYRSAHARPVALSRVCLMSANSKRSYNVAMKLQAVDVAETTSAARQFVNAVYMARALAERNKRRPRINAGVTANRVLPHTGPPGTDPLAESIPRNESASIFDPPPGSHPLAYPILRRVFDPTRNPQAVLEMPSCRTLRCVYIPCILCRHVIL